MTHSNQPVQGIGDFAVELGKAIGLGENLLVRGFTLHCYCDDVIRMEVTASLLADKDQISRLTMLFRERVVAEPFVESPANCTCNIETLMASGCICGNKNV